MEAQELRFRLLSKSSLEQIEVWEAEVEEVISDEGSNFAPGDLIAVVPFVIALDQSSPPLEQSMIGSFSATNPESYIVDWVKLLTLGDTELELSDGTRAVSYATYRELRLFSPAECVEELEDLGVPATEGTGTCPHGCTSFSFKSASPFFLLFGILWTVVRRGCRSGELLQDVQR